MSQADLQLVARGFEHFASTGDLLDEIFHPDFVWDMSTFEGWPEQQQYPGIEGARKFMADWSAAFDDLDIQLTELLDAGDRVLAVLDQRGRSKTTGMEVGMRLAQVWSTRDAKQYRMEMYSDVAEARRAAGLPAEG